MDQISLPTLKAASSLLTWAAFWLAITTAVVGWLAAQVRSETGRRSDLRVATAEQSAAEATSTAAKANERAEALKADNLQTQERLVDAERALEAERTARIELEKRLQPRQINHAQCQELARVLASEAHVGGKPISVAVFATTETAEARLFADSLAQAFSGCGFTINRNTVHYGKPYSLRGVGVLASNDQDGLARGSKVRDALIGVSVDAQMLPLRDAAPYKGEEVNEGAYLFNQAISLMVGDR